MIGSASLCKAEMIKLWLTSNYFKHCSVATDLIVLVVAVCRGPYARALAICNEVEVRVVT